MTDLIKNIKGNIDTILLYLKKHYRYFSKIEIDNELYEISLNKDNPNKIIFRIDNNKIYNNKFFIIEYTKKNVIIKDENNHSIMIYLNGDSDYNRYKENLNIKLLDSIIIKLKEETYFQFNNLYKERI